MCRWVKADLWGEILNSNKPIFPLFNVFYKPYNKRPANFVLRIDQTRPQPKQKIYSRYGLAILERRRLSCFYSLSISQLRNLILQSKNTTSDSFGQFVAVLESMLHIVLWRSYLFATPDIVKRYIRGAHVFINKNRTNSIFFRVNSGDFISFGNLSLTPFLNHLRNRSLRFNNNHFLFNFRLIQIFYLTHPKPIQLFNYWKPNYKNAFFTLRYRRR